MRTMLAVVTACMALWVSRAEAQATPDTVRKSLDGLSALVDQARAKNIPTLYAEIPLTVGKDFVEKGWNDSKLADRRDDWAAFLLRNIKFETDRLTAALAGKPDPRVVPPIPDYAKLKLEGAYLAEGGKPRLIVTAGNSGGGTWDPRYVGRGDLYGIVSAVGASRYNYQDTPIWKVYQDDPKSHRVYDGGWCGHIIKDRWSDGGQGGKTECIISLDYPPMREAVRKSIVAECAQYKRNAGRARILTMDWEFTYMNYDDATKVLWQKWLKDRHATVQKLNEVWKTDFKSFDDVTLPPVQHLREHNPAKYYDYGEFNCRRFTDYLLWAKKVIAAECPGYPMCVGGGQPFGTDFWREAIDEEYLMVEGVDDVWLSETGSRSWGTASFMDLQHSIAPDKMILDPEYHSTGGYLALMFLHGCGVMDVYGYKADVAKSFADGYAMIRGTLDVRRLEDSVAQFPKATRQAAVLYSRASLIQNHPGHQGVDTPYTLELQKCYRAGTVLDTPMGFVTTRMLTKAMPKDLKVLVIPGAYFADKDEVKAAYDFAKAGGTVVITPTSFVADEYDRRVDYLKELGVEIVKETVPKYLAGKARSGLDQAGSEYDFIQGPIAPTVVEDEPKAALKRAGKPDLAGKGIRQAVKLSADWRATAAYDDGTPAVAERSLGTGRVVYVAMQLDDPSLSELLDGAYTAAKVARPVRAVDAAKKRIPGLECRAVAAKEGGTLVYLYNMTDRTVKPTLSCAKAPNSIENLSLVTTLKPAEAIELGPYEFCVLKLR